MFNSKLQRHFNRVASFYQRFAFVQQHIGADLLSFIPQELPKGAIILDVGCATGVHTQALQHTFPDALVIGCDLAYQMCSKTKASLQADTHQLPLADESVDILFANSLLPWLNRNQAFSEWQRVLKPNGQCFFSTFGPNTLQEIFTLLDRQVPQNLFEDMHVVGDECLKSGLAHPMIQRNDIQITYKQLSHLLKDLHKTRFKLLLPTSMREHIERQSWKAICQQLSMNDQPLSITYEVLYGMATKGIKKPAQTTYINADHIPTLES